MTSGDPNLRAATVAAPCVYAWSTRSPAYAAAAMRRRSAAAASSSRRTRPCPGRRPSSHPSVCWSTRSRIASPAAWSGAMHPQPRAGSESPRGWESNSATARRQRGWRRSWRPCPERPSSARFGRRPSYAPARAAPIAGIAKDCRRPSVTISTAPGVASSASISF